MSRKHQDSYEDGQNVERAWLDREVANGRDLSELCRAHGAESLAAREQLIKEIEQYPGNEWLMSRLAYVDGMLSVLD